MLSTWSHGDIWVHAATEGRVWVLDSTAAEVSVDVHGPYYHRRPCGCLWSVLKREAVLMSLGWAKTEGHIHVSGLNCSLRSSWCPPVLPLRAVLVYGLCRCRGPGWCPWSVLPQETMLRSVACPWFMLSPETPCKFMIHVPANSKGLGSYFSMPLMTVNSQLRTRDTEGFCDNTDPCPWYVTA